MPWARPTIPKSLRAWESKASSQTGQKRLDTDQPILVKDRVRYFGEPLALVAAESRDIADHAAELIEFELEPIPGVYDPRTTRMCSMLGIT